MGKIAFLFPGQGSQEVGMGKDFYQQEASARRIMDEADQVLGFSLTGLCFEGPEEELKLTINTQPALFAVSAAILETIREKVNIVPDYVAGHSLGEYTAFYAAGAISFARGVELVRKRGKYMEEAVPAGKGAMSAVLGMDRQLLRNICEAVSAGGNVVELANINCPGQIVISGTKEGVEEAGARAKENGAKRVIPLTVSGPFHSSLMKPAAVKMENELRSISDFQSPRIPVVANVNARLVTDQHEMVDALIEQVYSPVLWEDSIQTLIAAGVDTFIEIGSGSVLTGLVKKIDRSVQARSIHNLESLHQWIEELKGERESVKG